MSDLNLEILAHELSPLGLLCLRRRELLSEPGTIVTEVTDRAYVGTALTLQLSIGFVLGHILENSLRQSITIADGSIAEFLNTPIGIGIYVALILTIVWGPAVQWVKSRNAGKVEDA